MADHRQPHLLVTGKSAYGTGTVSTRYFRALPVPVSLLRADRLLGAAQDAGGDPLTLQRMFSLDPHTAVRYCTELSVLEAQADHHRHAPGQGPSSDMDKALGSRS